MKNQINRAAVQDDTGFTLIEILTVVIIIAILAVIAIPMYLIQREKAWDASVRSDLYNGAISQAAYNGEFGAFADDIADLEAKDFHKTNKVNISIKQSGEDFCMEAFHQDNPPNIFFVRSGPGEPNPREGTCPAP